MPRTSPSAQTGGAALDEVAANFARIGWGPARNPEPYDLGTDLWIQVRDRENEDRGILVGAQVKGGASYFSEAANDDGGTPTGWWFRADAARFDYWSSHAVPHLIVLHDLDTRTSYWAHATPNAVERTGTQCKILVPRDQTVSDNSFDELLAVAVSQRAARLFAPSVWNARAAGISEQRRWRHALLVPRAIAPHPNRGLAIELEPEEAAALVVTGHESRWSHIADHVDAVPNQDEARAHDQWSWRFAAALAPALDGELDTVVELLSMAPGSSEAAAATIVLACQLAACDEHVAALTHLTTTAARQDLAPVDKAWLLIQIARFRAETGDVEGAVQQGSLALQALADDASDVTAAALIASAGRLVWTFSDWTDESLENVVTRGDTPAVWWRSHERGDAYEEYFKASFSNWSAAEGFSFSVVDQEVRGLLSAATTADFSGDHGTWCSDSKALGRLYAMRAHTAGDGASLRASLDLLRRVGDDGGVQAVLRRIVQSGPLEVVPTTAPGSDEAWWTRTAARSNFRLWESGADLLTANSRAAAIEFCIGALRDPKHVLLARARPRFHLHSIVLPTLASLLRGSEPTAHSAVEKLARDLLTENLDVDVIRHELRAVVLALDWGLVEASQRDAWLNLASSRPDDELAGIVIGALAEVGHDPAQSVLVDHASGGAWQFVARVRQLEELTSEARTELARLVEARLDEMVTDAEAGTWGIGMSIDFGALAVRIAASVQDEGLWSAVQRLVTCPVATAEQKSGACTALAFHVDDVPAFVKTTLANKIADVLATRRELFFADLTSDSMDFATFRLRLALGLARDDAVTQEIVVLLTSVVPEHRIHAAALIGLCRPAGFSVALTTLLGDAQDKVRREAAFAIGMLASGNEPEGLALALAISLCGVPGRSLPHAVLAGIDQGLNGTIDPELRSAIERLGDHPSALIRERSVAVIGRLTASSKASGADKD